MSKTELSIIIVSFNTKQITKNCIESIFKSLNDSQLLFEIIVVDNGSTDGTVEMLKKYQIKNSTIKLIINKRNLGFGRGNNRAVNITNSDYLLFLNSDIRVLDDAIAKLFNFYKQHEKLINFLGGKLLNENMNKQPSCGPFYSLPVIFASLFLRGDYWNLTRYSPKQIKEVDWISGACILTKKEYFDKLNGFDENIFMYMDEIDLLYRAKKLGYRIFFYPDARFIHLGFASTGSKSKPVQQVFKGLIYFYHKHCGQTALFLLTIMLRLKAIIGIVIGKIIHSEYLTKTYEEAYKNAWMDR